MNYIEDLYEQYMRDPQAVEPSWRRYFEGLSDVRETAKAETTAENSLDVIREAYRRYGHVNANIDPLGVDRPVEARLPSSLSSPLSSSAASPLISRLRQTYCGSIGFEYEMIHNAAERQWLQERIERLPDMRYDGSTKKNILRQLVACETLEKYLDGKYVGQKRFSIEGADSLIPMLNALIDRCMDPTRGYHTREVVIGMAHRGRLNVLLNIMGYPADALFAEFEGKAETGVISGDVKYHKGYARDIASVHQQGHPLHVSLAFNPSHLEFINPVIVGSVRARQDCSTLPAPDRWRYAIPVQIHGDAAFSGQGVVMETLSMSKTRAYTIGGSLHIVINNQVGFTTSCVKDARSSLYCTDVAKMLDIPIFHVNGDDPEACVAALELALDYRMQFYKDVVIDLVCYRRYGHQEVDEPMATQPMMYQKIKNHRTPMALYAEQLEREKICTVAECTQMIEAYRAQLDKGEPVVASLETGLSTERAAQWSAYLNPLPACPEVDTRVDLQTLKVLATKIVTYPETFQLQRQVNTLMESRKKMAQGALPADWGFAETMAYASLLNTGHPVRMSGEDCRRGTFYHRHAVLHDQVTGQECMPLLQVAEKQARVQIYDSLLSEAGALGFEYGYAATEPRGLVIWEAQYGDFANGAQVIIDQFISCGCQKWDRFSGVVLLLPHGYEGDGPEHSSARLERYLQLCAEGNMQVCVPTNPAQIFHLLRRQALSSFRRPLVIMSPKGLLRHKLAVSSLEDLAKGSFQCLISDSEIQDPGCVTRVILCSGKVYYDLWETRQEENQRDVALVRIEQLYPFPETLLKAELARYSKASTVVWCQQEPHNQGAWLVSRHRVEACLGKGQSLCYAGREAAAAPATGYSAVHKKQQAALIQQAFAVSI